MLRRTSYCFDDISSEPITISIVTDVPATPNITAHGNQPMCPAVGVILESDVTENIVWSTGETTASITVHEEGAYNVSTTTGCGTSTGWANVTAFLSPSTVVTINDQTLTSTENNATSHQPRTDRFDVLINPIIGCFRPADKTAPKVESSPDLIDRLFAALRVFVYGGGIIKGHA